MILTSKQEARQYMSQGQSLYSQENYEESIKCLNKSISLCPDLKTAYKWRALSYFKSKQMDKSVADFTKVITYAPASSLYYIYRSTVYKTWAMLNGKDKTNLYKLSFDDIEKSLSIEPGNATAIVSRAFLYEKLGKKI